LKPDLPVAIRVRFNDFGPAAVQRLADRAETVVTGAVSGLRTGSLAHAVTFEQRNVEAQEVFEGLPGDGRGADAEDSGSVEAQIFFYFAEDLGDADVKTFVYFVTDKEAE